MEDLTNLMRLIDLNSTNISEGHYLEMCNSIKKSMILFHLQIQVMIQNLKMMILILLC